MPVDLDEKYIDKIKKIIKDHISDSDLKIYLFGSRARGNAKKYSDVDIALKLKDKKIESKAMSMIAYDLEMSTIPYKVDVIDLNEISAEFMKCIKNDLVEI